MKWAMAGRGPVHEQTPVHDRLFMLVYELGGGRGSVHEPAPVHERLFIGLVTGLFYEQETLKFSTSS